MNGADSIRRAQAFLQASLNKGEYMRAHPAEKAYRLEHSYRVAHIGREIARSEGLDEVSLVIACLLHDVAYGEDWNGEDGWREHGRRGAAIARPFLRSLGMDEARVNEICFGIAIHVDDEADFAGERTPLALSVGDADNLDRLDLLRLHEGLCREAFLDRPLAERQRLVTDRLARVERLRQLPLATPTAVRLWTERLDLTQAFLSRLDDQLRHSLPPTGSA